MTLRYTHQGLMGQVAVSLGLNAPLAHVNLFVGDDEGNQISKDNYVVDFYEEGVFAFAGGAVGNFVFMIIVSSAADLDRDPFHMHNLIDAAKKSEYHVCSTPEELFAFLGDSVGWVIQGLEQVSEYLMSMSGSRPTGPLH